MYYRFTIFSILLILVLSLVILPVADLVWAGPKELVKIERKTHHDRTILIDAQIPVIAEFNSFLLAFGEGSLLQSRIKHSGFAWKLLDNDTAGWSYFRVGLRVKTSAMQLKEFGIIVLQYENIVILKCQPHPTVAFFESPDWMVAPLILETLKEKRSVRLDGGTFSYQHFQKFTPSPLVQEIVEELTPGYILQEWADIVDSANTRYSTSSGCQTAAQLVYDKLQVHGLSVAFQYHTNGHAPNVIATIEGKTDPEKIIIVIGHLDDMPSFGNAPGANDNASGAALVTTLASILSNYAFDVTLKFLVVTGEELGLLGSYAYAQDADERDEDILAVLNADMIGWEGDGWPSAENLDLNYNSNSDWLATLISQVAADYNTGCSVNPILCPSMVYSDHAPFWNRGWAAVGAITDNEGFCGHAGNYPFYHSSQDTIANCGDPSFYISTVKTFLATAAHLAQPLCRRPDAPIQVQANSVAPNRILLKWSAVEGGELFEIFRKPGGCSASYPSYKIGESQGLFYLDTLASGNLTSAYHIVATDSSAICQSPASECAQAATTGICLEPPVFEGLDQVVSETGYSCRLILLWSDVEKIFCGTDATFNIYRSLDPDFQPAYENLTASGIIGNSYSDWDVSPGQTYFYIVRAEDNDKNGAGPGGGHEDYNTRTVAGSPTGPLTYYFDDDFEGSSVNWDVTWPWSAVDDKSHSGNVSMFSGNQALSCSAVTVNQGIVLPDINNLFLTYWIFYNLETSYDGVQVQISGDDGLTWELLTPQGGYSGNSYAYCTLMVGYNAYTGYSEQWKLQTVDLSSYQGQSIKIRFVMASDDFVNIGGFYLDDVGITGTPPCYHSAVPALQVTSIFILLGLLTLCISHSKHLLFQGK